MSSSNSPCAACKFLRRKCTQECVFAPYFPADNPARFANVHKVFGASNVAKILNELDTLHREDAVNSLAYEAELRLKDPVYGCVGIIQVLHHHLKQLHVNLDLAKKELASMVGPAAVMQMLQSPNFLHPTASPATAMVPYNMMMAAAGPGPGPGQLVIADFQQDIGPGQMVMRDGSVQQQQHQQQQQQHQMMMIRDAQLHQDHQHHHHHHGIDPQQLAAMQVREEQEIMRNFEQLQQQPQQEQQMMRFNNGNRYETGGEFCQQPLLALGTGFDGNPYQAQQQQPLLLLQQSDSEAVQNMEQPEQLQFHEQPAGSANETATAGQPC